VSGCLTTVIAYLLLRLSLLFHHFPTVHRRSHHRKTAHKTWLLRVAAGRQRFALPLISYSGGEGRRILCDCWKHENEGPAAFGWAVNVPVYRLTVLGTCTHASACAKAHKVPALCIYRILRLRQTYCNNITTQCDKLVVSNCCVHAQATSNPPNKLLLVEGLPPSATADMLELVCKQFLGLIDVRMADAKPGIAFVEYDSEPSATQAMTGLQGFVISQGHTLAISYAK
jgi:hypothetical protein